MRLFKLLVYLCTAAGAQPAIPPLRPAPRAWVLPQALSTRVCWIGSPVPTDKLGYICEHDLDSDKDGVPDWKDFCPGSTSMAAPATAFASACKPSPANPLCVDRNGCNKLQVDIDGDGFCTVPSPHIALPGRTPVTSKLCKGADTCSLSNNPQQSTTACGLPGTRALTVNIGHVLVLFR